MFGERLKLARKRAGLSLRGLADRLDGQISAQAIGKYERSEMMPSSPVLIMLSKTLGLPLGYFMSPMQARLDGVEFRQKSGTTVADRARVEAEVLEHVERYLLIEEILGLDSATWNNPLQERRRLADAAAVEELAATIRDCWALGTDPIPNMTQLLEQHGIKVLLLPLPEGVDGLTCLVRRPDQGAVPCVVVNRILTLERRRLTLAHEIGHRFIDPESAFDPEKAAQRFAGAFLMPADHVQAETGKHRHVLGYREMVELKRLYRVSATALLVRLEQLGIISRAALTHAYQTTARNWRKSEPEPLEPVEFRGQEETPTRFERLCYRALAEDLISLPKAAELLQKRTSEIEAALNGPGIPHACGD
jgi:Zn-dependent peptidase ImmA (M78 family)/transcriptional regulator with XRE-family HTH domain